MSEWAWERVWAVLSAFLWVRELAVSLGRFVLEFLEILVLTA